jgi:circadian clock protein KaiC
MSATEPAPAVHVVKKVPTGIRGFDELCAGGLPEGRVTLVCGGAGTGKTIFGMEVLARGAREFAAPGLLVSFDESARELAEDVSAFDFGHEDLVARKLLAVEVVRVGNAEPTAPGGYDLDALLGRLERSIASIGAKRIVLDAVDVIFDLLAGARMLRTEFARLLRGLKALGATVIVTCERGSGTFSRYGLEEYLADCVIALDQRVQEQIATRRLRIVKYRGSLHAKDEVPFTIDEHGLNLAPIASVGLDHTAVDERISMGVPRLDTMLGGQGVFRGSTVLISGVSGAGKTSIAAHALVAACGRGERCSYFAFEESSHQIMRNMRSIGLDLERWVRAGVLEFHVARPTSYGLERHFTNIEREIERAAPRVVVIDPISGFDVVGTQKEVHGMLTRLVDCLKRRGITAFLTSLAYAPPGAIESTSMGLSSIVDTWLLVQIVEGSGERNRALYVLKSRGMAHSNQVREFVFTDQGVDLVDVYVGTRGVLTGTARLTQAAKEQEEVRAAREAVARQRRELALKQRVLQARIAALEAELEATSQEAVQARTEQEERAALLLEQRRSIASLRHADEDARGPAVDG